MWKLGNVGKISKYWFYKNITFSKLKYTQFPNSRNLSWFVYLCNNQKIPPAVWNTPNCLFRSDNFVYIPLQYFLVKWEFIGSFVIAFYFIIFYFIVLSISVKSLASYSIMIVVCSFLFITGCVLQCLVLPCKIHCNFQGNTH